MTSKTIGRRIEPPLTYSASATALKAGVALSASLSELCKTGYVPKGVYRYASHAEANAHDDACLAQNMAMRALERDKRHKDVSDRLLLERAIAAIAAMRAAER